MSINKLFLLLLGMTIAIMSATCSPRADDIVVVEEAIGVATAAPPFSTATFSQATATSTSLSSSITPANPTSAFSQSGEAVPFQIGEGNVPNLHPEWDITPFKVGEAIVRDPEPGWRYIAIYYGIENLGTEIDYFLAAGHGPRWLESIIPGWRWSKELPPSDPGLASSYIDTNEGYQYEPKESSLWSEMAMIQGDDSFFLATEDQGWNQVGYAPNFQLLPPIPPGFRLFGSILFKVAGNTTGHRWIIPGLGEFELDAIGQELSFPFDAPPSYLKQVGESLELEDGNRVTVIDFARHLDGRGYVVFLFENPTGLDFNPNRFQTHLINERGWLVPQRNYFACRPIFESCPHQPPVVGPGQQVVHPLPWQIPPEVGDLYLELFYNESMDENGHYNGGEWAVFELPRGYRSLTTTKQKGESKATRAKQKTAHFSHKPQAMKTVNSSN